MGTSIPWLKTLQRLQLNKTDIIKNNREWQNILMFQYSIKMHKKLFWPKSKILISKSEQKLKSAKICDWDFLS